MANLIQWSGPETGTSWDSTKVYRSDTGETGTYNLITTVSPIATTTYWDTAGDSNSWYKIAFYKTSGALQGPYSVAFYAGSNATLYTNPTELRKFMQFDVADFPNDESVTLLLEQAHVQLAQDVGGTTPITTTSKLKLLALFLGSSYVCRSLATRALSKGYISVSLEGGSIMKAHDALMRLADYYFQKYQEQLAKDTVDYSITSYLGSVVGDVAVQDIKDMMNGVSDALDYQASYIPSINSIRSARGN